MKLTCLLCFKQTVETQDMRHQRQMIVRIWTLRAERLGCTQMCLNVPEVCLRRKLSSTYLSTKTYWNIVGQGCLLLFITEGVDKLCSLPSFPILMTLRGSMLQREFWREIHVERSTRLRGDTGVSWSLGSLAGIILQGTHLVWIRVIRDYSH